MVDAVTIDLEGFWPDEKVKLLNNIHPAQIKGFVKAEIINRSDEWTCKDEVNETEKSGDDAVKDSERI